MTSTVGTSRPGACGDDSVGAARLGCAAAGIDPAPVLLDRARSRAAAEGRAVELLQGDPSSLPFADASFDAVISLFGSAFLPDAAAELLRVCKPGGTIALAAWIAAYFSRPVLVGYIHGVAVILVIGRAAHRQRLAAATRRGRSRARPPATSA
jgi:ubiquinone/menaquinone biosynthesis C-methylase UbiE